MKSTWNYPICTSKNEIDYQFYKTCGRAKFEKVSNLLEKDK